MRVPVLILTMLFIQGCSLDSNDYDSGYSDGYAVGYNTQCNLRSTMVKGDWDNLEYSKGYKEGYSSGSFDCEHNH